MEHALCEARQRKSEFVAMLAHELHDPLTPICNALDRLASAKDARRDKKTALLEMALRQVDYMLRLKNDLVEVERVDLGKIRLETRRVDLVVVIERATDLCWPGVTAKGQSLGQEAPKTPLAVTGDPVG